MFRTIILLLLLIIADLAESTKIQQIFNVDSIESVPVQRCFNIGDRSFDGPFEEDTSYFYYFHHESSDIVIYSESVEATRYQRAFREQRKSSKGIFFVVRVIPGIKYKFSFGLAQMDDCYEGHRVLTLKAGSVTKELVDSISLVGCQRAHFVVLTSVEANEDGYIFSSVCPQRGQAALSTVCITRSE